MCCHVHGISLGFTYSLMNTRSIANRTDMQAMETGERESESNTSKHLSLVLPSLIRPTRYWPYIPTLIREYLGQPDIIDPWEVLGSA